MPLYHFKIGSAQTDGNGGYPAAVSEMFLQNHRKAEKSKPETAPYLISLLPALPEAWQNGSETSLRARSNFNVDMEWKQGKVTKCRVASPDPRDVKVRINGETKTIRAEKL